MLISQIKDMEAILSNSTRKQCYGLKIEINKMLIAVKK